MKLSTLRDLTNPLFKQTALRLSVGEHGIKWSQKVFAMAGFKPETFLSIVSDNPIQLGSAMSLGEKEAVIRLAIKTATECEMVRAGYMWKHPLYGSGVLHRGGVYVDSTITLLMKGDKLFSKSGVPSDNPKDKGWSNPALIVDPTDPKFFILREAGGVGANSGYVKKSDVVGFWSNFMASPLEPNNSIEKVFKSY